MSELVDPCSFPAAHGLRNRLQTVRVNTQIASSLTYILPCPSDCRPQAKINAKRREWCEQKGNVCSGPTIWQASFRATDCSS